MKLQIVIDGENAALDLQWSGEEAVYNLAGSIVAAGSASIVEASPGVFSLLLGAKSVTINVLRTHEGVEAWAGGKRFALSLADLRDRSAQTKTLAASGPMQIRAHMPGKVVKLMIEQGTNVEVGQGLVVVEAMKMQNEIKSPKSGVVTRIHTSEGATVAAGEILLVVD